MYLCDFSVFGPCLLLLYQLGSFWAQARSCLSKSGFLMLLGLVRFFLWWFLVCFGFVVVILWGFFLVGFYLFI